jgi:hypothetical protein
MPSCRQISPARIRRTRNTNAEAFGIWRVTRVCPVSSEARQTRACFVRIRELSILWEGKLGDESWPPSEDVDRPEL